MGERSPDVHDLDAIRDDGVLMTPPRPTPWQVVVPIKGTDAAKTRLGVAPSERRLSLARAFALDTLDAVANALSRRPGSRLVVVSVDTAPGTWPGADEVIPDPGLGLNPAVTAGLGACDPAAFRAVLLGDLPALRPADLDRALAAAEREDLGYVADEDGRGTVLVTAGPGIRLVPRFGPSSAHDHDDTGHAALAVDLPRLRADVDSLDDLDTALALGVGAHTHLALAADS